MEGYDTHENMNTVLRTVENSLFDVSLIPTHSKAIFYSNVMIHFLAPHQSGALGIHPHTPPFHTGPPFITTTVVCLCLSFTHPMCFFPIVSFCLVFRFRLLKKRVQLLLCQHDKVIKDEWRNFFLKKTHEPVWIFWSLEEQQNRPLMLSKRWLSPKFCAHKVLPRSAASDIWDHPWLQQHRFVSPVSATSQRSLTLISVRLLWGPGSLQPINPPFGGPLGSEPQTQQIRETQTCSSISNAPIFTLQKHNYANARNHLLFHVWFNAAF